MTLMQRLIDAGYPPEDIFHWQSDLQFYDAPLTRKIFNEWISDNSLSDFCYCLFMDNETNKLMYEVAFAYDPFWEGQDC